MTLAWVEWFIKTDFFTLTDKWRSQLYRSAAGAYLPALTWTSSPLQPSCASLCWSAGWYELAGAAVCCAASGQTDHIPAKKKIRERHKAKGWSTFSKFKYFYMRREVSWKMAVGSISLFTYPLSLVAFKQTANSIITPVCQYWQISSLLIGSFISYIL